MLCASKFVGSAKTNTYIVGGAVGKDCLALDVGMEIFHRGLCLPSDNKMMAEQQGIVIEIIKIALSKG